MDTIISRVHYKGGDLPSLVMENVIREEVWDIGVLLPYLHAIVKDPLVNKLTPSSVIRADHAVGIDLAERTLFNTDGSVKWYLDRALVEHGYYLYARPTPQTLNLQLPNCRLILTNPY